MRLGIEMKNNKIKDMQVNLLKKLEDLLQLVVQILSIEIEIGTNYYA